jgi:hypothetical protein
MRDTQLQQYAGWRKGGHHQRWTRDRKGSRNFHQLQLFLEEDGNYSVLHLGI